MFEEEKYRREERAFALASLNAEIERRLKERTEEETVAALCSLSFPFGKVLEKTSA